MRIVNFQKNRKHILANADLEAYLGQSGQIMLPVS
jgi:hypothetical protein